jgi:tRNA(Arg) A34 adenosine deaminase TadA
MCEVSSHPEETRSVVVKSDELTCPRRRVELAAEALAAGDEPFGSVLVGENGAVPAEDHTWVASGEPCPMCAAAHAWVGLGRIVYVASSDQLSAWLRELCVPAPPVRPPYRSTRSRPA